MPNSTPEHDAPNERAPEFTPESIRRLVDGFYRRVRNDPDLGPIFERVVGQGAGGWPPHLDKMVAFWSAVLLGQPGYGGNPRHAHRQVAEIQPRHFARWLFLFRLEAHGVFEDGPAREVVGRAEMMAVHLQRGGL